MVMDDGSIIRTVILGAVQGLCEFLPVSSSGHLTIFQILMGFDEDKVAFDLLMHCATLLAVILFFRRDIWQILCDWFGGWRTPRSRRSGWAYCWAIIIASFITAIIGLGLKSTVDKFSDNILLVGIGEIFTAIVLLFVPIFAHSRKNSTLLKIALAVGFAQGIAVLPGVSRSGMSIAMGLFMGLGISEAFRFSFLISIPAVLGATLLEILKFIKSGEEVFLPEGWIWGALVAFVLGIIALGFMRRLVNAKKWAYFGVYCLIIGVLAVALGLGVFQG